MNAENARTVADFSVGMLKRRFGIGGAARNVVIGVGDQLRVTIFEAGADGLFSTQDSKKTDIDVVVQPDGKAAIPYVGQVQFSGRTLEQARQAVLSALANKGRGAGCHHQQRRHVVAQRHGFRRGRKTFHGSARPVRRDDHGSHRQGRWPRGSTL